MRTLNEEIPLDGRIRRDRFDAFAPVVHTVTFCSSNV